MTLELAARAAGVVIRRLLELFFLGHQVVDALDELRRRPSSSFGADSLRFESGGEVTGQTVRVTEAGDIRWGTPAARWVHRRDRARFGHRVPRRHDRQRRPEGNRRRPRYRRQRSAVDDRRVPRHAHRVRCCSAGRSAIASAASGCSSRVWCRSRSRAWRAGLRPRRGSRHLARRAGRGRRAARARQPRDHRRVVPRRRPRAAIGAWSGLAGISGAVGPFLGGWLIDTFSWRWVFLINVPLAIDRGRRSRSATCRSRVPTTDQPIDGWGAFLAALGLTAVLLGADRERQRRRRRAGRRGSGRRRRDRGVPDRRGAELAPDAAAPALPEPHLQRGQRHDARGVRRARRRAVPGRAGAPARVGLLGARGGRGAGARHDPDAVPLVPGGSAGATHRATPADDDRPAGHRGRPAAVHSHRPGRELRDRGAPAAVSCSASACRSRSRRSPRR